MKKHIPAQTIIQQIQPQCDTLHTKMKHQKDIRHETNQSVADNTGIPISNIAKFFSGALTNPSVFYVAAISIFLGMSLDELLGIAPKTDRAADKTRIAELEAKLERKNEELGLVKHHNEFLEAGIKERKENFFALTVLCSVLIIPLVIYLLIDISNSNFGFFQGNDVSVIGIIIAIVLAAAVCLLAVHVAKEIKSARKNTEKD